MKFKTFIENQNIETATGSKIKRFKNNVGKLIGGSIYVHKNYAELVVPKDTLDKAKELLGDSFEYNCVKFDIKPNVVRFDQAAGFDDDREPFVGNYITVTTDGKLKKGISPYIWHHKWLWVKDDYNGFNVQESKEWSALWLSKFKEPASGVPQKWEEQLRKYGLEENI
jgi:hypothetical protein